MTELLQEHVRDVDVPRGRLRLGRREFSAELIGSEARTSNTFLWGWANPEYGEAAAPSTLAVRRVGADRGIPELVEDSQVPTERLDAFTAAVVTVGVADLDAYYLAPYEYEGEGVLALGIRDPNLRVGPPSGTKLTSTFMNLIDAAPPFSHRRAFAHYLARPLPSAPAEMANGRVVLTVSEGVVRVSFDREGRIGDMRAELRQPG